MSPVVKSLIWTRDGINGSLTANPGRLVVCLPIKYLFCAIKSLWIFDSGSFHIVKFNCLVLVLPFHDLIPTVNEKTQKIYRRYPTVKSPWSWMVLIVESMVKSLFFFFRKSWPILPCSITPDHVICIYNIYIYFKCTWIHCWWTEQYYIISH
jgi:hypothetical protein